MPTPTRTCFAILSLLLVTCPLALGDEWPAFRGDLRRSGIATTSFEASTLREAWCFNPPFEPSPAWPGPARWDAYAGIKGLKSMRNYDPVFHVVATDGRVLFGTSTDDTVRCLDAENGKELWRFTTGGPVRVPPMVEGNGVFFGSDDGYAYRVDLRTGALVWKFSPTADRADGDRLVINNGRLISFHPVRSGVVVGDGTAYFAAAMLPWKEAYLCAVDAETGRPAGEGRYVNNLGLERTFEGPLLLSGGTLVAPQGRIAPMMIGASTGEPMGALSGGGGSFVLLTDDDRVLHGPGNKTGWITDSTASSRAKVAAYERGNAIVVSGGTSYLLGDESLAAMDRETKSIRWMVETDHPFEIVLVGDVLYAGGDGEVAAYDTADGHVLWSHKVEGRAHGLAAADGRLLVSTDEGSIYCFVPEPRMAERPRPAVDDEANRSESLPLPEIVDVRIAGLEDRWVFDRRLVERERGPDAQSSGPPVVRNLARGNDASILGVANIETLGGPSGTSTAMVLDGRSGDMQVAEDFRTANPPTTSFTAEAWVRLDEGTQWGGILGMTQDNGSYEKGWILGYRGEKFGVAVNGTGGHDGLTWLVAPEASELGAWHHVAGSYDGETIRLYVNGQEVASSTAQSGEIDYAEWAYYHIAAYRDEDEYFRLNGMLAEVRRYNRTLSGEEITQNFRERAAYFPEKVDEPEAPPPAELAAGPMMRFIKPGVVEISYETKEPSPTLVRITGEDGVSRLRKINGDRLRHRITVDGLERNREYRALIEVNQDGELWYAGFYDVDTHFDYAPEGSSGWPREMWVVADLHDGSLALMLASQKIARVVALTDDAELAERVRERATPRGLTGTWLSVLHVNDPTRLPLPPRFANRVGSERADMGVEPRVPVDELLRLVQPGGELILPAAGNAEVDAWLDGMLARTRGDGSRVVTGPRIEGSAPWTHMYGDASNAAFMGETLSDAKSVDEMELQWIGRPGPRYQSDRQNRKPSPLAAGNTLYMQGLYRIIAMNAYNGMIKWDWELPKMARFNVPRDCANWCADEQSLYVAIEDRAYRFNADTGDIMRTFELPVSGDDLAWGYIARTDRLLIGSAVQKEAQYTDWWGGTMWYDGIDDANARKVCSDVLFGMHATTGQRLWSYEGGLVINPTITIASDETGRNLLTFAEVREPSILAGQERRLGGPAMWSSQFLIALDPATGRLVWERPLDTHDGVTAYYAAAGEGTLTYAASSDGKFGVETMRLADGETQWSRLYPWETDHHGKHLSRPAIARGAIFLRPHVIELDTGEPTDLRFPPGHQCGTYACSTNTIILRAGNLTVWDRVDGDATRFNRVRPDCWLSTIPALGMLLSPEGGGGCSCGSWMETSFAMMPLLADPRHASGQ